MADGVFRIAGGTHHSLAVEFRDFVAVIEAPQNEERSLAVIAEVEKLIPNKPIRYLVNTHHHFDHLGGLRTYATMGTTIVTHEANHEFYDRTVLASTPRTMQPDRFSAQLPYWTGGRQPEFETLNSKYVISDGVRVLDVHALEGVAHNANMLVAYLPKEKILVNADLYLAAGPGRTGPRSQRQHDDPLPKHPTIEAGRGPTCRDPWGGRDERRVPEYRQDSKDTVRKDGDDDSTGKMHRIRNHSLRSAWCATSNAGGEQWCNDLYWQCSW